MGGLTPKITKNKISRYAIIQVFGVNLLFFGSLNLKLKVRKYQEHKPGSKVGDI